MTATLTIFAICLSRFNYSGLKITSDEVSKQ